MARGYCDCCDQTFDSLQELVNHIAGADVTDDGDEHAEHEDGEHSWVYRCD